MKTIKMTIRLTEYEKKKLEQEADKRGMNQSEVLRSLIARFPEPKDSV
ncbi:ribbon-helix-helix protein, CopG family [Moorena producens JHB]|uniref:Ribbon-helix-helix protein, CopG family n=1 Tax=Moorena producens (strain JHB) TaxID=1454205 RepID=A0A1D9G2S6_MOOP1|nr:ribbon-helix-helix protein, CopG family [Moorena producens]AOY81927.1 ribbon-helix-helix protein, CopG family [Moorena producens JHB]